MINLTIAIRTLSPLHCGIGVGMNDIDLPVARHKVSGHPVIPGSTIKGVLKDEYLKGKTSQDITDRGAVKAIFGDPAKGNSFASAISIEDGLLVALPVRSYFGTFGYLASPYTLQQLKKALVRSGVKEGLPALPAVSGIDPSKNSYRVLLTKDSLLVQGGNVLLEEMDLSVEKGSADDWAAYIAEYFCESEEDKEVFIKRFAIVDDNVLNFLCDTALPVDARIAIDKDLGTVKNGALWYEESVPPEALFMSVAGMDRSYRSGKDVKSLTDSELLEVFTGNEPVKELYVQMGGKATTGKGFVAVRITSGGSDA
ncbi:type III-B CRISPR module RAMP protein Cmr4 [Maridesulfovibrio sp.]|uniref:type III-B CRISPR module RAMP protein Cmr4 n=1 Tax=unclassified Maridesulfovibrio TaxID=2794999 RepID=UPI003B00560E